MSGNAFQIGLVGAGAISAGAYTGGVVDFLILALDEWHKAKASDPTGAVPGHEVVLKVFSGASAGGMTAAIAAGFIGSDQPHVSNEQDAQQFKGRNKLFDSWVESIDIRYLLETEDLEQKPEELVSVLDSTVLSRIAANALNITATGSRSYVANDFQLLLTVTNLRGVPYGIGLSGGAHGMHRMSLHADYMHFCLCKDGASAPEVAYAMRWQDLAVDGSSRQRLLTSAMATGAFPVGLAPRVLSHQFAQGNVGNVYARRLWDVPAGPDVTPHTCFVRQPMPTQFGGLPINFNYEFQCVDGGVMNNEPLELARRVLSGDGRNPREGDRANAAVILIDPFPSDEGFDAAKKPDTDLFATVLGMFGALVNQARFKPDELVLASQENVYSRFLISPSRGNKPNAIACGVLGGFGGFLKRDFRAHDYFLGRRNAQKFLLSHFCLPENNPLFTEQNWPMPLREQHYIRGEDGKPQIYTDSLGNPVLLPNGQPVRLLPIIPLIGKAAETLPAPAWPSFAEREFDDLMARVDVRAGAVLHRVAKRYLNVDNWVKRQLAKPVIAYIKSKLLKFVAATVREQLRKHELMK